jgi:hypothetical protein
MVRQRWVGAPFEEGRDDGTITRQEHVQERHRGDLGAMRDRQFDDLRLVHEQRMAEHVVLDRLALFMSEDLSRKTVRCSFGQAVQPRLEGDRSYILKADQVEGVTLESLSLERFS